MKCFLTASVLMGAVVTSGCGKPEAASESPAADASFRLDDEPGGAADVLKVRESAQDKDEVVVVGRIGGSAKPWVEGLAAFSIVDPSLKACSDIEGDECPMPWDYCCESSDDLAAATALVKLVDGDGKVVKQDAREVLKVKELDTVVVQGAAERDDAGNLTILASGVFVRE